MIKGVKVKNSITNVNVDSENVEHSAVGAEMLSFLKKFEEIEEKNKCLRVQFLDWLSDKLLDWSNKCHVASVKIDSPCVIKVEPRKKEESNDAPEHRQIAQLKEDLQRLKTQNDKLWEDRRQYNETVAKAKELLKDEK